MNILVVSFLCVYIGQIFWNIPYLIRHQQFYAPNFRNTPLHLLFNNLRRYLSNFNSTAQSWPKNSHLHAWNASLISWLQEYQCSPLEPHEKWGRTLATSETCQHTSRKGRCCPPSWCRRIALVASWRAGYSKPRNCPKACSLPARRRFKTWCEQTAWRYKT